MDNTQLYAFSNVHLKLYNKKNKRLIKEIHKKNTITKYTLNGIASMLKGEFNDTNYIQINKFVPKYVALGTNTTSDNENITVNTYVTVNDDSLYGEILKNGKPNRIRLEQASRIDNVSTNEFVKIRFKTLVMSGVVDYNANIQELGLFVDNTNIKGGLFARITTEPITIPENSVLDVQWDIVLTSSTGVYPTSVYILDDTTHIISNDILTSGYNIPYQSIKPITADLRSSVIDLNNTKIDEAHYIFSEWNENNVRYSTNNFNSTIKCAGIVNENNVYKVYTWVNSYNKTPYNITYNSLNDAKENFPYEDELTVTDIMGNTVLEGANTNIYKYKDVTYSNCVWNLYKDNILVENYDDTKTYNTDNAVFYGNTLCICNSDNVSGSFDKTKWYSICNVIKYMTNIVFINTNTFSNDYALKLEVVTATNVKADTIINIIHS